MKKPSEIILDLMKLQNKSVNQVIQCMEIDRLTFHKLMSDNLIFSLATPKNKTDLVPREVIQVTKLLKL